LLNPYGRLFLRARLPNDFETKLDLPRDIGGNWIADTGQL